MNPLTYMNNLSATEAEVEYAVRGLRSGKPNHEETIIQMLFSEQKDPKNKPKNSHVTSPTVELDNCRTKATYISKLAEDLGVSPTGEQLIHALCQCIHWKDRTERLKESFGSTVDTTNIITSIHRSYKWFSKLQTDILQLPADKQNPSENENLDENKSPVTVIKNITTENNSITGFDQSINNSATVSQNNPINLEAIQTNAPTTTSVFNQPSTSQNTIYTGTIPKPTNQNWQQNLSFVNPWPDPFSPVIQRPPSASVLETITTINNQVSGDNFSERCSYPGQNRNFYDINPVRSIDALNNNLHVPVQQNNNFQPQARFKFRERWNLSFDGKSGSNVHDFIYKLEIKALDDNLSIERLTSIIHLFLSNKAEDWYWIFRQNNPNANWVQMKNSIIAFFSCHESDDETKEQIMQYRQSSKESFSDFALHILKLNGRLRQKLTERELINRFFRNMHPALRNVTLHCEGSIQSVEQLRILCQRFERMWDTTGYDPRSIYEPRRRNLVHEIQISDQNYDEHQLKTMDDFGNNINAIFKSDGRKVSDTNIGLICWNCKDLGHRYQDCDKYLLHQFCFGCGRPGIRKPNCLNCQKKAQGNLMTNTNFTRDPRSMSAEETKQFPKSNQTS